MKSNKLLICVVFGILLVSTGFAQDIEPPPTPGDVDTDGEPEEDIEEEDQTSSQDEEGGSDNGESSEYNANRIDQDRGVDETGDYSSGGMQETGISGVISSIGSFFSSLIPF